jgi:uncharacterized protein YutD
MSSKDYAKEFKDSFLNKDIEKLKEIIFEWYDYGDANFGLSLIILSCLNDESDFNDIFKAYMKVLEKEPANPALFDWFNATAISLMEKRVDDEIGLSQMFNNKYKIANNSNGYAKEFLDIFDEILENDTADRLDELKGIVSEWEENCSDDANMHCAYVILNFKNMSNEELEDRAKKARDSTPIDKNSYAKLLTLMDAVLTKVM